MNGGCDTKTTKRFADAYEDARKDRAKLWAFEKGYTKEFMDKCFSNALAQGNKIVTNFVEFGHSWESLNRRCLQQLVDGYSDKALAEKQNTKQDKF